MAVQPARIGPGVEIKFPISWSKPFLLDVTGSLQSDGDHLLAIRVHNYSGAGGLYKPVTLMVEQ